MKDTYLDLVNINLAVLLLELLVRLLHRIDRRHCIPQVLRRERGGFHVERLLRELCELRLVHSLLLQCPERTLLDGVLRT